MREAEFIRRNRDKWQDFEKMIGDKHKVTPDQLSDLFIRLTDDLAYSRTYYPESRTVEYLNALAATVHLSIYKNKREEKGRLVAFWKYEVPEICFQHRKEILYALLFFLVFTLIGAVSAAHEPDFVRIILGDAYVNKTLENIKAGRPMGIYASMDQLSMFFQITLNNILVAFRAFIMGVLGSIGTIVLLFYNGVMLGSFQYFFHQQGLLLHSASTIWLHGTIEISVIVIAGGAGLIMGNSLLFPGTYPRMYSFKQGALKGVKLVVSLVPFFILAGFIESFVTRYEFMHWTFKVVIIAGSAALIVFYFGIYPWRLEQKKRLGIEIK